MIMTFDSYYFVTLNRNKNYEKQSEEEERRRQLEHQQFLSDLNKEGILLAAGPFTIGGGILFFDLDQISEDELSKRLKEDPHTIAGSHTFDIKTWFVPKHTLTFTTKEYNKMHFPVD